MTALAEEIQRTGKTVVCIAFSPRSGSTLLCNDLARAGLGRPTEIFQEPRYGEDSAAASQYILDLIAETPGDTFSFKVSWSQAWELGRRLGESEAEQRVLSLPEIFGKMSYIHLDREDKVAQAISWWRAARTGQWHTLPGQSVEDVSQEFDFDHARKILAQLQVEEMLWRGRYKDWGVVPLNLEYDNFLNHRLDTVKAVCGYLGAEVPVNFEIDDNITKMADEWSAKARLKLIELLETDRSLFANT